MIIDIPPTERDKYGTQNIFFQNVTGWDTWTADPPVPWDSWIPSCSCLEASMESFCIQYAKHKASFYSAFSAGRDQSSKWRGQRPPFWANSMPGWSILLTFIIYIYIIYIDSYNWKTRWTEVWEQKIKHFVRLFIAGEETKELPTGHDFSFLL